MGRRVAARSEVVERGHKAAAEKMTPNTIDSHAGSEGIRGIHEPSSKVEPVRPRPVGSERMEHRGRAGLPRVAAPEEIAAHVVAGVAAVFFFDENRGCGRFVFFLDLCGISISR